MKAVMWGSLFVVSSFMLNSQHALGQTESQAALPQDATTQPSAVTTEESKTVQAAAETPVARQESTGHSAFKVSDGKRIELKDRGFSIVPPAGWEFNANLSNLSLLMQVPHQQGVYQRTIQVAHGGQEYSTTGSGAEESVETIVAKRAKATAVVENYVLRNQQAVTLTGGEQAVLFYTEFKIGSVPMMEMHLLTGNINGHFLVTYTDVAENFNMDNHRELMNEVYNSLTSIKVDQPPAPQYLTFTTIAVGAAVVLAGFLLVTIIRKRATNLLLEIDSPIVSDLPAHVEENEDSWNTAAVMSEGDEMEDDGVEISLKKTKVHKGKMSLESLKKDPLTGSSVMSLDDMDESEGMEWASVVSTPESSLSLDLNGIEEDDDGVVSFKFPAKVSKRAKEVPVKIKK